MKPAAFEYFNPATLPDALALLDRLGDDGKVLAGGQSLVPMLNFRLLNPACLIDINGIDELAGIGQSAGELTINAMTRHVDVERSAEIRSLCPLIHEAMPWIAHFQIRNRGTFGGSLAHADPAAELPAAVLALGGKFVLRSAERVRIVPASDFFTGYLSTCLEPNELLVQVLIPPDPPASGSAFLEVSRRHGDFALVGVAARVTLDPNGTCGDARLVLTGVAETPIEAKVAIDALRGMKVTEAAIQEASIVAAQTLRPQSDLHATAQYRTQAAQVLTARALSAAAARARSCSIGAS